MALVDPLTHAPAVFERRGLGWVFRPDYAPVMLTFDRLAERRDEVTAELHIMTRDGGHLARRRINLLGSRVLTDLARDMDDISRGSEWPWRKILAEGCESALEGFRQGSAVVIVEGELERPKPIQWTCQDIVMANVVNVWVAAASTGKSTLLKAFCLHHALGIPFLGHEMAKGVPLYLDYEDTEENFRRTLYQVAAGLGIKSVPRVLWKRGGGPLRNQVHQLGELIDKNGVTLLGIDAVAAAGGEMGDGNYETVALGVEQAVIALPPVTMVMLDHITSAEMKDGGVPLKARGAARKYEFARYQWTIVADKDAAESGRHVVGWTHTKSNLTRLQRPFATNIIHEDDKLMFGPAEVSEVQAVASARGLLGRCIEELEARGGPLMIDDLAMALYEVTEPTRGQRESIRKTLRRDEGRLLRLLPNGSWELKKRLVRADNVVRFTDFQGEYDDEPLPF